MANITNIKVQIDTSELDAFAEEQPRKIKNALRSAITTTTTWARKEVEKRLSEETGIKRQVFKSVRLRSMKKRGDDGIEQGRVWLGYNPIKAHYVGKLSQDDSGAWAGQYFFKGGFIRNLNGDKIFKRKPEAMTRTDDARDSKNRLKRGRLPIEVETVALPQAERISQQVASEAEAELLRRFRAKFQIGTQA